MAMSRDEIFENVRNTLVEALAVEPDEVTEEATAEAPEEAAAEASVEPETKATEET